MVKLNEYCRFTLEKCVLQNHIFKDWKMLEYQNSNMLIFVRCPNNKHDIQI